MSQPKEQENFMTADLRPQTTNSQGSMEKERSPKAFCAIL